MSDAPPAGTLRAGRYVIIGVLGAGSQAETLDAVDKREGRAVAIKRFQVRGARSWKDVELAEREARVLSTLSHPNLPVYVEHFEEEGALYLVMEKIEGETLASLRRRRATLSSDDIARFLADADGVLGYLHSRMPPLIHRDIKPGNVIRRADGSFALVDFGSVRDQLKPEGGSTVVGTFGYMAPEQFQGRALPGSDVYAVGATALSLVTGREPEDLPHRGLGIDVPAALGRGAEPWLVRALSAMLEPDPDKRPTRVPASGSGRRARVEPTPREARAREPRAQTAYEQPHPTDERAWREQAREQARAQRRYIKDEERRLRRELHQQIREQTSRVRRDARSFRRAQREPWRRHRHGFGPLAPLLISLVILALTVARVATWALFRVFLPTLLTVLSLGVWQRMRRAAWRCHEVGVRGDRGLRYALDAVRGRMLHQDIDVEGHELDVEGHEVDVEGHEVDAEPEANQGTPRARVASPRQRVDSEQKSAEFDEYPPEIAARERREPR